ncbi:MAG: ABC transporter permease [Candidatus Dormibacteraeota bacterium]|uniref:Oligopeptide transport system permease protein OppC n=1 Tax=Candidatus Amunia macphersoniae TaxID=3127014 RepID=A0A934NA97_9BACT|nr:ABC transporter permease [Candidatus Dormibacteraeota bacterium]
MTTITTGLNMGPPIAPPGSPEATDYSIAPEQVSLWQDAWRRFRRNKLSMLGIFVFAVVLITALVSIFWTPYSLYQQGLADITDPLSRSHPFGVDSSGRDVLSYIMKGALVAIEVGVLSAVITSLVGISAGLLAGYFRGWVDSLVSGITYIGYGIPNLLIAFLILFIFQRQSLLNVIIALSVTSWMDMARLVRGQTLALREREYVEAARATGTKDFAIMVRHVLPNALGPIIVQATFLIPQAILFEAFLSFLGFGLPSPDPSWGAMVSTGLADRFLAYHTMIVPSIALLVTLMAVNFIGDGLRDALDPRLKR